MNMESTLSDIVNGENQLSTNNKYDINLHIHK